MSFNSKAWLEGGDSSIRLDFRCISIQLFSPHQPCLLALIYHCLKEATKHLDPVACADTRQAGMIRQRLAQVVPKIPSDAQTIDPASDPGDDTSGLVGPNLRVKC